MGFSEPLLFSNSMQNEIFAWGKFDARGHPFYDPLPSNFCRRRAKNGKATNEESKRNIAPGKRNSEPLYTTPY